MRGRVGRHRPRPGVGCISVLRAIETWGRGQGWTSDRTGEFWERGIREMRLERLGEGMAGWML